MTKQSDGPVKPHDVTDEINKKRVKAAGKSLDEKLSEAESIAFYDHSSERAMAIILSAIVENHLTELLRLLMRRDKKVADELFNPIGPLGPFGVKIRVAYMLRIISDETYNDLMAVSKIRNKFAHDLTVTTFEDHQIAGWIKNMHTYGIVKKMADEAAERIKNETCNGSKGRLVDTIASNAILSIKDSYRHCLRYLIHYLIDYEMAIKSQEKEMGQK